MKLRLPWRNLLLKPGSRSERFAIRFLSHSRRVDGLWVGIAGDKKEAYLLQRVEDALQLIKQYDPLRYRRVLRDIKRIWISIRISGGGEFNLRSQICHLDKRLVENSEPKTVASVIVHEATHGYPCLRKIGYAEKLRYRVEQICMSQQLSFARRLPDANTLCEGIERNMKRDPSFWSNSEFLRRRPNQEITALKAAGIPDWLIKLSLKLREARWKRLKKK